MEAFFKDLKHSLRILRQTPSFTLAAVSTLALGIESILASFSVVNTVLLRPRDVPAPDAAQDHQEPDSRGGAPSAAPLSIQIGFHAGNAVTIPVLPHTNGIHNRATRPALAQRIDPLRVNSLNGVPVFVLEDWQAHRQRECFRCGSRWS